MHIWQIGGFWRLTIKLCRGGMAGTAIEEGATRQKGVEITVKLDGGRMIAVTPAAEPNEVFKIGDRVRVLSGSGVTRVAH